MTAAYVASITRAPTRSPSLHQFRDTQTDHNWRQSFLARYFYSWILAASFVTLKPFMAHPFCCQTCARAAAKTSEQLTLSRFAIGQSQNNTYAMYCRSVFPGFLPVTVLGSIVDLLWMTCATFNVYDVMYTSVFVLFHAIDGRPRSIEIFTEGLHHQLVL